MVDKVCSTGSCIIPEGSAACHRARQVRFYQTGIPRASPWAGGRCRPCAQYPGQIAKKDKDTPELRAVAVLEWTGDEGKPKTSRLVPITVYDGQALQDGGVYLARPQPLALASEVEYELEKNGDPVGLFDIRTAGQEQGSWVGFGSWKPLPSAKPAPPNPYGRWLRSQR